MTAVSETVRPSQDVWESFLLCLSAVVLVVLTGLYTATFGRQEVEQTLQDWQISAYSDLSATDQALYSQLLVAMEDIDYFHQQTLRWPDDSDFQDMFLAPFYRDLTWERNGSVQWSVYTSLDENGAGITWYHGHDGTLADQGAWLLLIDHRHAGVSQINDSTIWWNADPEAAVPDATNQQSLILNAWRQVVPYQGRDEVERLNAG